MEWKSQHKQDEFIAEYFNNKREGVFVDIGAHDGESLSNTYVLEKEFGWSGICIEPMPHEFKKLAECRDSINYNCAIYNKNGSEKFTMVESDGYPDMLSGITKDITFKHMNGVLSESQRLNAPIKIIDVQTRILNEILEENEVFHIDVLSIDTEGAELKILKSIDYDKFYIDLIIYENGPNGNKERDFLKTVGFKFYKRLGIDDAFINTRRK